MNDFFWLGALITLVVWDGISNFKSKTKIRELEEKVESLRQFRIDLVNYPHFLLNGTELESTFNRPVREFAESLGYKKVRTDAKVEWVKKK